MSRILIAGSESTLTAGVGNSTTIGNATVVRVVNNNASTDVAIYVQDSSAVAIGSATILSSTSELIQKKPTDYIYALGGNVLVSKVGFTG